MGHPQAPPQSVLDAFNVLQPLQPLSGGRGLCFSAGDIILRPVDDRIETEWLSDLLLKLGHLPHAGLEYRVARPHLAGHGSISPSPNQFISGGWSVSSLLPGKEGPKERWHQLFIASRAFHRDLKLLVPFPPAFLSSKTDRWAQADRVAWDEKPLEDIPEVNADILAQIKPHLDTLSALKKPIPMDALSSQLVHADLTGNVLFDVDDDEEGYAPAIIDIAPYWRPVEFAEAVVVADGLLDHGQGRELVEYYGTDGVRLQVLVRALYWRILTLAIQSDLTWVEEHLPGMDIAGAVGVVSDAVEQAGPVS